MQEVKFNYQNITAEVSADSVKVINKNLFVNTDIFDCEVTVAKNGKVIRRASLATAVAPLNFHPFEVLLNAGYDTYLKVIFIHHC